MTEDDDVRPADADTTAVDMAAVGGAPVSPAPTVPAPLDDAKDAPAPDDDVGKDSSGRSGDDDGGSSKPLTWGYPEIDGVTWRPFYAAEEASSHAKSWITWTGLGLVAALVLLVVATALIDDDRMAVLGIGAAAIGGLAMIAAGIAWLAGEVLRAERNTPRMRTLAADHVAPIADMFRTLKEGLGGLTAPRALIFAGAFLLAVAAIAGAIAVDRDGDDPAPGQTEQPTGTPTDEPAVEPTG